MARKAITTTTEGLRPYPSDWADILGSIFSLGEDIRETRRKYAEEILSNFLLLKQLYPALQPTPEVHKALGVLLGRRKAPARPSDYLKTFLGLEEYEPVELPSYDYYTTLLQSLGEGGYEIRGIRYDPTRGFTYYFRPKEEEEEKPSPTELERQRKKGVEKQLALEYVRGKKIFRDMEPPKTREEAYWKLLQASRRYPGMDPRDPDILKEIMKLPSQTSSLLPWRRHAYSPIPVTGLPEKVVKTKKKAPKLKKSAIKDIDIEPFIPKEISEKDREILEDILEDVLE